MGLESGRLEPSLHLSRAAWLALFLLSVVASGSSALIFLFNPDASNPANVEFRDGQPSAITVLAPERITYPSRIETQQAQAKAADEVPEVYTSPDDTLARVQQRSAQRILRYVDTVRQDPYGRIDQKLAWIKTVPTITLSPETISRTLALDDASFQRVISETLYVLDVSMREGIREGDVVRAAAKLPSRVSLTFSQEEADLITEWAAIFLIPNSFADPRRTEQNRQRARDGVGTVYRTVEKGQAVVRTGEVITPLIYEALQATGNIRSAGPVGLPVGPIAWGAFLTLVSDLYLLRFRPSTFRRFRFVLLYFLLFVAALAGAKLLFGNRAPQAFLYPTSAFVMLATVLLSPEAALGMALGVGLGIGYIFQGSLELAAYTVLGSLVGILALRRVDRLTTFIFSGATVALINILTLAVFRIGPPDLDLNTLALPVLLAAANGALSGLLALGGLFILGKLFDLTTPLELIELARPTQPLLQQLLREAPGTYHHSLIVGNLAEHAAERIGADSLLVRVGAYYHDIGKMLNPQFYVENQLDGRNPHDELEPRTSASIVHRHVLDGTALARKHRLPTAIRSFIPAHHGTTLTAFFYHRALERESEPVEENEFRYPGPKPHSREAAIVMLADGVEATSRSERPTTALEIRAIIDRSVGERLRDGQLDQSDLTLQEIDQIKQAFFEILQGLFHPRIRYPQLSNVAQKNPAQIPPK